MDQSNHSHECHHDHSNVFHTHAPIGKMKFAFFLTLVILIVEVVGAWISNSLALWSDAGHVLTDIAAIGLAWYAMNQSKKAPNERLTFGYHRSGILAAFINAASLIVIALIILWEAIQRFQNPESVGSTWMFISASVGLIVNLYLGLGFKEEDNLNVRAAVLHMLGDAAASAGVIVGGIIILLTGWNIVDPILSVLIAFLIAFGAWKIMKQTIHILMEGTPSEIQLNDVISSIRSVSSVQDVHDIHIWSITSGRNALSCHIVLDGQLTIQESQSVLREVEHKLLHHSITHVTVQLEDTDHPHENELLCCDTHTELQKHPIH